MKRYNWTDFKGGWFIGDFSPSMFVTPNVEVCIKRYNAGDYDRSHYHKLADEVTMIVDGVVEMNGVQYHKNDILHIERGETTDFRALSDAITCVVKIPCVKNDKYLTEQIVLV